ncbi:MAG: hybrid sensor histidine kinase/response regulator [Chloroflexi bacterium]|nr:hybrid sensor histidine kinase/response regulator [Chloroflexota bacterium]
MAIVTRSPIRDSAALRDSLVWVRADTFGILLGGVGILLWLWVASYLGHIPDFWPGWGLPLSMLVLTGGCYVLKARSYRLASGLFIGTLLGGTVLSLFTQGEEPLVPFLFAPTVLITGALRGDRAAFLASLLASAAIGSAKPLVGITIPPSTMWGALALVWLVALSSWATTQNLYTALHWAWTDSEQSSRNLAEARKYQGELAAALRQLEEATYRLERANYALARARAEADEARQLKAQFAAHVSHELRTPINLVVGFAELMLSHPETYGGTPLPDTYVADLSVIHRSAKHLRGLIDDILDLSQIDAGAMPVLKEITDIGALVNEAVATAQPLLERKGLAIKIDVAPSLPLLNLDRLRIRQVLLNLLNNAVRFTELGGIGVRVDRDEDHVLVEVADTGVGIRPEDLGKLFEPFHQLESSPTRGRGGTGLGLAICRRFVELHGGRIWASSEGIPGQGSIFGFALPLQPESEPAVDARGAPPGQAYRRWELPSAPPAPTVVLLDDDPSIVNLFRRRLDEYRVEGVTQPMEAIKLAARLRAHAIVTDLPNGASLDEWQRDWERLAGRHGVRVVGCPMPSGRRVARALGLVDYLVKPVTREALLESVKAVAPPLRSAPQTVLVVDDEPQMVRLLCNTLRASGTPYHLRVAYDGEQALEQMSRTVPDLVLLDLLMPQVGGLTVLEKMRADPVLAHVPVIAVSARGAIEAISPSVARTVALVSDEPFPVSRLLGLVKTILNALPPAEPGDQPNEPAPPGDHHASGVSG